MKRTFKKNITVTFACIMNELFICAIPMVIILSIFVYHQPESIPYMLGIFLFIAVFFNVLVIVVSLISRATIKTSYEIENNLLTIKSEHEEDEVIDLNSIAHVAYDFGQFGPQKGKVKPSELFLIDEQDKMVLALEHPPIAMVHLVKKRCKNAKVTHVNSNRFIMELGISIIVTILLTLFGIEG